jgi:hypothetical protein
MKGVASSSGAPVSSIVRTIEEAPPAAEPAPKSAMPTGSVTK